MIEVFGTAQDGREIRAVTLRAGQTEARVLTLGAILQACRMRKRALTVGAPHLAAYDNGPLCFFGAVIGPVAGRIGGANGRIDDAAIAMEANDGPNALHSGRAGLHRTVWDIERHSADAVTLVAEAAPGDGGLPGARRFRTTYAVNERGLRLELEGETDRPTWINLTQHSYWHLSDDIGIDGHSLEVAADAYLPIDGATLPTGEIADVSGTAFDFRLAREIGPKDRLDHCFCLPKAREGLRKAACLAGREGWSLALSTDAPGLQIHTGDGVTAQRAGPAGVDVSGRPGLALEAQAWPDAPNHAHFPSIRLDPGRIWLRTLAFEISPPLRP
ncbi:MAG: aldose epimerase family protein [Pseudomonadota bacterium]